MIEIEQAHAPTDDVRVLIGELDAELAGSYAPEQRHGLTIDAIFKPPVRCFVASAIKTSYFMEKQLG